DGAHDTGRGGGRSFPLVRRRQLGCAVRHRRARRRRQRAARAGGGGRHRGLRGPCRGPAGGDLGHQGPRGGGGAGCRAGGAPRGRAQDVRTLVDKLKAAKRKEAVDHRRVHRPWGYYDSVDMGERFQVKRIVVRPGGTLSLQKHLHRSEHWVVVRGTAEVTIGEATKIVHENESAYIPLGTVHRLKNPGKIPLELIEVQTGSYFGEDDIIRLDDGYRRG